VWQRCACLLSLKKIGQKYVKRSKTSYKMDRLTNLNKYLHNDTSKTEANIDKCK
jgi:hypothetical protein